MEVRLNKMEMTVSVCRFYDLFFFFTLSPSPSIYGALQYSRSSETEKNPVGFFKIVHVPTDDGALSMCSLFFFKSVLN